MPLALVLAFAASLGLHFAALFGPDIDLSTEPETTPLLAELRLAPPVPPSPEQAAPPSVVEPPQKVAKAVPAKKRKAIRKPPPQIATTPQLTMPESAPSATVQAMTPAPEPVEAPPVAPEPMAAPVTSRLPSHGIIRYRVDRGDSNFEIGVARHEWEIVDGRYRLVSELETTGLAWLFKSVRIDMESTGTINAEGFRPDSFAIRREGQAVKDRALFDWDRMKVRVGNRVEQALAQGAQDLLSFNYQLGYMDFPESGGTLSIATGKKYGTYRLEVIGNEQIETPAGVLRTLHLRAPGDNTTELWLAYDYLLLPVKIRHVDSKGDSLVQVATEIRIGTK